jgi:hypothetical protein
MDLSPRSLAEIGLETSNLANAQAPESLPLDQRVEVNQVFDLAFVDAFQILMYVCAGLVVAAALVSLLMIEGKSASEVSLDPSRGSP